MPQHLLFEGPDLQELLTHVRSQHGPSARIVKAERVRSGGVAGFFARQTYELTVSVETDDVLAAGGLAGGPSQPRPVPPVPFPPGTAVTAGRPATPAPAAPVPTTPMPGAPMRTTPMPGASVPTTPMPPGAPSSTAPAGRRRWAGRVAGPRAPRPSAVPVGATADAPGRRRDGEVPAPREPLADLLAEADAAEGSHAPGAGSGERSPEEPVSWPFAAAGASPVGERRPGPSAPPGAATPTRVRAPVATEPTFDEVLDSVRRQLGMTGGAQPVAELPTPQIVPAARGAAPGWSPASLAGDRPSPGPDAPADPLPATATSRDVVPDADGDVPDDPTVAGAAARRRSVGTTASGGAAVDAPERDHGPASPPAAQEWPEPPASPADHAAEPVRDRPVSEIVAEIVAKVEGATGLRPPEAGDGLDRSHLGHPDEAAAPEAPRDGADEPPGQHGADGDRPARTTIDLRESELPAGDAAVPAGDAAVPGDDPTPAADRPGDDPTSGEGTPGEDPTPGEETPADTQPDSGLLTGLSRLGVPTDLATDVARTVRAAGPLAVPAAAVLAARGIATGGATVRGRGAVAVAGPAESLARHSLAVAHALDLDEASVLSVGDARGTTGDALAADPDAVARAVQEAEESGRPVVLLVPTAPTLVAARRTSRLVRSTDVAAVVGVWEAARSPASARRWIDALGASHPDLDAWLALTGCEDVPAAVAAATAAPVLLLDHRPATVGAWCGLLVDGLAQHGDRGW